MRERDMDTCSMRRRDMDDNRDKGEWQLGIWVRGRDMDDRKGQGYGFEAVLGIRERNMDEKQG
jgi:hypothetical protein